MTAVTNYNKFGGSEPPNQFYWVKIKMLAELGSFWRL